MFFLRLLMVSILISILCGFSGESTGKPIDLIKGAEHHATHGRYDIALTMLNKALEQDPRFVSAYKMRASIYLRINNRKQAYKDYDAALELVPNLPEIFLSRGMMHSADGHKELAAADFKSACNLNDDNGCTFFKEIQTR